jgi:hypothetical protein
VLFISSSKVKWPLLLFRLYNGFLSPMNFLLILDIGSGGLNVFRFRFGSLFVTSKSSESLRILESSLSDFFEIKDFSSDS